MYQPPRLLILFTVCILFLSATSVVYWSKSELPPSVQINWKGHPTIGYSKARVHVVLFEEPKCVNCKAFNEEIFPKIKKDYIDTNKITYTIIPVSFLPGSMPAAMALLCVFYSDPLYPNTDLFFKYLDYMYQHQPPENSNWATPETLLEFAQKTSPAINTEKLKKCIDMQTYRIRIEQNTNYGKQVMGGMISTPGLFVNGIEVKELSADEVSKLIKEVLEHEGVH